MSRCAPPRRECAALSVVLERDSYAPGDTIAGMVLLEANRPISDAVVTVDLRGRECVEVSNSTEHETQTGEQLIWFHAVERRRVSLTTDGMDIPFSIELPTDLPATTQMEFGSRRSVKTTLTMVYDVQCALHVTDDKGADVTHSTTFTITALPLARRLGQPVEKARTRSFHHGYLLKKSSCRVHVQLDTDVVTVDSIITANVDIQLNERERLQAVSMALWRRIVPNPSQPLLVHSESKRLTVTRQSRVDFDAIAMPALQLTVPPSMLAEVGPLKPTLGFHHFCVVYEVVVTCEVKSCRPIVVALPITLLPLESRHPSQ